MEVIPQFIDMNSNITKKCGGSVVRTRCCNQELCRQNTITTAGGVVSGDINLNVDFDLVRNLECNDLTTDKKFTLLLVTDTNMLSYS